MREVEYDEWGNLDPGERDTFLLFAFLKSDSGKAFLLESNLTFQKVVDFDYNPFCDDQYLTEYSSFIEAELKDPQTQERIKKLILKRKEEEKRLAVERDLASIIYKAHNDLQYGKILQEEIGKLFKRDQDPSGSGNR